MKPPKGGFYSWVETMPYTMGLAITFDNLSGHDWERHYEVCILIGPWLFSIGWKRNAL